MTDFSGLSTGFITAVNPTGDDTVDRQAGRGNYSFSA